MAKTTGPLLSLGASGSVAGTMTFATWKGRPYVRQTVTPANPKSGGQTGTRSMMKFLSQAWAAIGGTNQSSWAALAAANAVSTFNEFVRAGMARWAQFTPPGQNSTYAASVSPNTISATTSTGGKGQATVNATSAAGTNASWGIAVFGQLGSDPTPAVANCVGVIVALDGTSKSIVVPNLAAGTWHFICRPFDIDGNFGTAHASTTAAVT